MLNQRSLIFFLLLAVGMSVNVLAQSAASENRWIRPADGNEPAVWGIRDGIVFGLWPYSLESGQEEIGGGPRGLIRVGHSIGGQVFMFNFIAVEPVVDGEIELSEISPSRVDGKWGKLMWAADSEEPSAYRPSAITRGVITHPDPSDPEVEELSIYLFMEQYLNGAHPYFRLSVRSDRPEELALEIFHREDSAPMERCVLTATMGNYARLRHLYLKDRVIDSRQLYEGYDEIHFIEKDPYPIAEFPKDENGDFMVIAAPNESFAELSAWPQDAAYLRRWTWRYRPYFKVTQYWRKEGDRFDPSLRVRVNGRARYWTGGSDNKELYVKIPGGPAFENFELREKYYPGQKFIFGITRKEPAELLPSLPEAPADKEEQ